MVAIHKLIKHCQGCEYFEPTTDGMNEYYYCRLLEREYDEIEYENEFYGDEGLLAVVKYTIEGDLIDVEFLDFYPKGCPHDREGWTQARPAPTSLPHQIDGIPPRERGLWE